MIEILGVEKNFGEKTVLRNINLSIKKGEIFGLIGPDGAGKTTLFNILATLTVPSKGNVMVNNLNLNKDYKLVRKFFGYMPSKFSLYGDLTIEENITFFGRLYNTDFNNNIDLVLEIYNQIKPFKNRLARNLSGGMKQKLALCCALIHKPTVLYLDEPTNGVDAIARKDIWNILKRLKESQITILISTTYMGEAEYCDKVAFLQNGRILQCDSPMNIKMSYKSKIFSIRASNMNKLLISLKEFELVDQLYSFGDSFHLTFKMDNSKFCEDELFKHLQEFSHTDIEFKEISPTIEDCFINLMNDKSE